MDAGRLGVGVAGGRTCPAPVLPRRRSICRRPTSRSRHRDRQRGRGPRSGFRPGHLRRPSADARPDGHHRDVGRRQGVLDSRRTPPRQARRPGRRRRPGSRERALGRGGARHPVRSPGRPHGLERDVRRSTDVAPSAQHASAACPCSVESVGSAGTRAELSASAAGGLTRYSSSRDDARSQPQPQSGSPSQSLTCSQPLVKRGSESRTEPGHEHVAHAGCRSSSFTRVGIARSGISRVKVG